MEVLAKALLLGELLLLSIILSILFTKCRSEHAKLRALEKALNLIHDYDLDSFVILSDRINVVNFMNSLSYPLAKFESDAWYIHRTNRIYGSSAGLVDL